MRQIVLDTETTGLNPQEGHRIIEIGCVELVDRRLTGNNFHCYLNPKRAIDSGAQAVHGLSDEFLADKPLFSDIVDELLVYLKGGELIIHNAPFDTGFLNYELKLLFSQYGQITDYCPVIDTLKLARDLHPGQRNSLDALCQRYYVNNEHRELHGALLDAKILAEVYLAMTGGQFGLFDEDKASENKSGENKQGKATTNTAQQAKKHLDLPVISANAEEEKAHQAYLEQLDKGSDMGCLWKKGGQPVER